MYSLLVASIGVVLGLTACPAPSAAVSVEQGEAVTAITYRDATGSPRTVLAEIRRPSASGPRPTVVWSHGGSQGKRSTERVGDDWGRAFTSAGFAFVAIAHPGRDVASREQLCHSLHVDDCSTFRYLDWDRPADVSVVLDWLETTGDAGLDLDHLTYGGHSAGARSVLRVAGADWPIPGDEQPWPDPRFDAFLVASPPGAEANGLTSASFRNIDRPVVVLSGAGDTTNGNEAVDRLATMELLPDDTFVSIWVDDEIVRHTTVDLDRSACLRARGSVDRCTEVVRGLGRAGTNFVRYVLRGRSVDEFRQDAAGRLPDGFEIG